MASMGDGSDHNRVIANVAREMLGPLGLVRKGRSRTWLDDNGWWLGVVEFQPSSWTRGSYLNVGAMWLWRDTDDHHIYFGLGHRIDSVGFADAADVAFEDAIAAMAATAVEQVRLLRGQLPTVEAAAAILRERAEQQTGWSMWDAAVALGLAGHRDQAAAMFKAVAGDEDDRDWWVPVKRDAAGLAELVGADPAKFDVTVRDWIDRYRDALNLPRRR
jgi:hypothetical protein